MLVTSAVPETESHTTGHADTTHRMARNPVMSYSTSPYPKVTSLLTVTSLPDGLSTPVTSETDGFHQESKIIIYIYFNVDILYIIGIHGIQSYTKQTFTTLPICNVLFLCIIGKGIYIGVSVGVVCLVVLVVIVLVLVWRRR